MPEAPEEIGRLPELLDRSAAGAGAHPGEIITGGRRLSAAQVCERLQGMRLLVVATVTAALSCPSSLTRVTASCARRMLTHYLPLQGPAFETWLDQPDPVGAPSRPTRCSPSP